MQLTFVSASRPLRKSFDADLNSAPADFPRNFSSTEEAVHSIKTFYDALQRHASLGHALVKGSYTEPLNNESRAGKSEKNAQTEWVCLDFDGVPSTDREQLMDNLGFNDVSYVWQYSASAKIKSGIHGHAYIMLNHPIAETLVKQYLTYLNLTKSVLSDNLTLTASGNAIHWLLDPSLAESHRLIYIAPPKFQTEDPISERFKLIEKLNPTFDLNIPQAELMRIPSLRQASLAALRKKLNLPTKRTKTKFDTALNVFIQSNPDTATITGFKEERDFCYFNLNGGDSWGYFHPKSSFEIIYNFKDEPAYMTKELIPKYYEDCRKTLSESKPLILPEGSSEKIVRFVCTEAQTGNYLKVTWDQTNNSRTFNPAKSVEQLEHFCMQHKLNIPGYIPEITTIFDPQKPEFLNIEHNTMNLYRPSPYKQKATRTDKPVPPTIARLLDHVLGNDPQSYNHFLNWVSVMWQHGIKPKTAWVLHGIPGTGKGALMAEVLTPLFGPEQSIMITTQSLAENFNDYLASAQILMIDEADTDGMANANLVRSKTNTWITEDRVPIRKMRTGIQMLPSYVGLIFTSNRSNPTIIDPNDRRYNVAPRQEKRLPFTNKDFATLKTELQNFANFLQSYKADITMAATAIENDAKKRIQNTTTSSPEALTAALLNGDFRYLIDFLPQSITDNNATPDTMMAEFAYSKLLANIAQLIKARKSPMDPVPIFRDDLHTIFQFLLGWDMRPAKFSKTLSKFGLLIGPVSVEGKIGRGVKITWCLSDDDLQYIESLFKPQAPNVTHIKRKTVL